MIKKKMQGSQDRSEFNLLPGLKRFQEVIIYSAFFCPWMEHAFAKSKIIDGSEKKMT